MGPERRPRGLRAALGALPPERALALGAALGRGLGRLATHRAAVADANLRIAFPDRSQAERARLRDEHFAALGRAAAETVLAAGRHRERLLDAVAVEGLEHLEAARRAAPGGGAIALTAHFGSWELGCAAMARAGLPLSVVHSALDDARLDRWLLRWRTAAGIETLSRGRAARAVLRALRSGRVVVMALDQDTPAGEGSFVPFFGRAACTREAPARIAAKAGAPVVPVFVFRRGEGAQHVVRMQPALPLAPDGDDPRAALLANLERMNRAIEEAIRAAPDHWIWNHRRFRTQPEGEPPLYPSRRRRRSAPLVAVSGLR
jgi:KDO2-lipid IV(A) lauroyltransferase